MLKRRFFSLAVFRPVAVLVGAVAVLWLTLSVTFAGVLRDDHPVKALSWAGYDAGAKAQAAYVKVETDRTPAGNASARKLAIDALARDPTSVPAVRTLGLLAAVAGETDRARGLFGYSERLSRRDVATQLWLIEEEVRRNDISGALKHFDIALRTSEDAIQILFPILVSASADDAIAIPLANMIEAKPVWGPAFVRQLIHEGPSTSNIVRIADSMFDTGTPEGRAFIAQVLQRLVKDGEYQLAQKVYRKTTGRTGREHIVSNGSFDADGAEGYAPFGWMLAEEPDLFAIRQIKEGSGDDLALHLHAANGRGGDVARQLLVLQPGDYALSAVVGNVTGDSLARPLLVLYCASGSELARIVFPKATSEGKSVGETFRVPASGCKGQWLAIKARSDLNRPDTLPWIDYLAVEPR